MANLNTISLYIHIPFCVHKCRYCDFYSCPGQTSMIDRFIQACADELRLCEAYVQNRHVTSIFFGGGTPSILQPHQWHALSSALHRMLTIDDAVEWTIECNPDSYSRDKAQAWLSSGVNRLSLGVQSLDRRLLSTLGRPHTPAQALAVLQSPEARRFASCSVDVMYGLPGQTIRQLEHTLCSLLSYDHVKHLSAYELTIAKNTVFGRHRNLLPFPDDDCVGEMAELIQEQTDRAEFRQYEISNYAPCGYESIHNKAYWEYRAYIGLGPGAHSFVNGRRWANISDLQQYCAMIKAGARPMVFTEELTVEDKIHELLFLGLRTRRGIDETRFEDITGELFYSGERAEKIETLVREGMLAHEGTFWRLTDQAFLKADGVAGMLG
ncbi:MAG: radical SAM family heme chaperone HemW [Chitinivibrionales bacterium]